MNGHWTVHIPADALIAYTVRNSPAVDIIAPNMFTIPAIRAISISLLVFTPLIQALALTRPASGASSTSSSGSDSDDTSSVAGSARPDPFYITDTSDPDWDIKAKFSSYQLTYAPYENVYGFLLDCISAARATVCTLSSIASLTCYHLHTCPQAQDHPSALHSLSSPILFSFFET